MADAVDRPGGAEVAAVYSNYFVLLASAEIVRISFGEAFGTPESATFRAAIALSPANAVVLAESILKLIKPEAASAGSSQGQTDGA